MPCLRPDLERRHACLHRTCSETRAQTVTGETSGVHTGGGDALVDNERDGLTRKSLGGNVAVPVDRPEDGTFVDAGDGKPSVKGLDRTMASSAERDTDLPTCPFLVGLGVPQHDNQALAGRGRWRCNPAPRVLIV
jgi:hypothetical protein